MDEKRQRKVKAPDAQALRQVRVLRAIYDARTGEAHAAGETVALDPRQWPVDHWIAKGVLAEGGEDAASDEDAAGSEDGGADAASEEACDGET